MATSQCSSTSTNDLYQQSSMDISHSCTQTFDNDEDNDIYTNYDEQNIQQLLVDKDRKLVKKSDQSTYCRVLNASVGCWTKPAYITLDSSIVIMQDNH
jgi:acetylglutamate synthase